MLEKCKGGGFLGWPQGLMLASARRGVKTSLDKSNYKRGTDVKLRAGHARPLQGGKQKGCTRKTVCSLKLFNSYRGIFCGACARY